VLRTLFLCLTAIVCAEGAVVYSNTTTDLGLQDVFSDAGVTEIGDQIALAPGPRQLQSVTAALVSYSDPVTADVILRIYGVGAGNTVGSLLGSVTLPSVSFAADSRQLLTFTGWNLTLPEELIWTIGFAGNASPVLGVEAYSPPGTGSTGSSDPSFAWWGVSGSFTQQSFPGIDNNYFLEIDATDATVVPEAGSFGAVLAGCVLILLRRRFSTGRAE
jgi:hypothetical protein